MDLLKTAFTNHAYSILILLCTIVAGGTLIKYRVEQLEELTAKQTETLSKVNESIADIETNIAVIKTNQENYIRWMEEATVIAARGKK